MQIRTWTLVLVMLLTPAMARGTTFTETFDTATYKDVANTTAEWDTVAGDLRISSFTPTLVGSYAPGGGSHQTVEIAGDLAFVTAGNQGLLILDISDPTDVSLVGSYDTPGTALGAALAGDIAFIADGSAGIQIVDVSNPASPSLVANYNTAGEAAHVAVDGNLLLVADYFAGLLILDVTNPASPVLLGTYDIVETLPATVVAVAGDLAFVVFNVPTSSSLRIVDISNPASPALVSTYNAPSQIHDLEISGNRAFLASPGSGLRIMDISNPASPTLLGSYDTPGSPSSVTVSGDRAFVGDSQGGLQIIDVSNPASPVPLDGYYAPDVRDVALAGDVACVVRGGSVDVLRIATSISPRLAGTYDVPGGSSGDLAIDGNFVFVTDTRDTLGALQIIDISDPISPALVGTYSRPYEAFASVAVAGDLAFVGQLIRLEIVDISNPASPTYVGGITYGGGLTATGVVVAGDHAFVTDRNTGLKVISIADPSAPTLVGSYSTPGFAWSVAVAGDMALVAADASGLLVLDISDPENPALLGSYNTPGLAFDVVVAGDLAFVADGASGLQIVDITNPAAPTLTGSFDTPIGALDIAVAGDFAFVADGTSGLHVLDITNPASPTSLGTYDTPGTARGIAAAGDHVFIADGAVDLHVIQVFQHEFDLFNIGQSLPIDGFGDTIVRARLASSVQSGDVTWELSANGGANFQPFTPGPNWTLFTSPGNDLVWRTSHTWNEPGDDPAVSEATFEWLNEHARIASVADVPNDQGGQVRVTWTRSGRDFLGDTQQITRYGVYRRNDALGWDFIATVPVLLDDSYSVVVPTLGDSTIAAGDYQSIFRVTAFTASPDVTFHSPPDSGYSVDNLPPNVPQGFAATYGDGAVDLVWGSAPDTDVRSFRVYRSTVPDFVPGPETLVHQTEATSWQDASGFPGPRYYQLTAVDGAGNESDPASTNLEPTSVGDGSPLPVTFALRGATPNPARTQTHIAFDLPAQAAVSLQVYDVSGRVVRTLTQGRMPAGAHVVGWDGKDTSDRRVPAGVYLYRLRAADFESTGRLTLIR